MTLVKFCRQLARTLMQNPEWVGEQEELRCSNRQRLCREHSLEMVLYHAKQLGLSETPQPKLSMVNPLVLILVVRQKFICMCLYPQPGAL